MEAVLLIGIPGVGKSTFYQQRFFQTHVRINLDMLKTRRREQILLQACIAAKQSFVVDNTNIRVQDRERYIALAKPAGFKIIGYYFQSTLDEAMQRNQQRAGKALIPEKGVLAKWRQLEKPSLQEGFDELHVVRVDPVTKEFIVEQWSGDWKV